MGARVKVAEVDMRRVGGGETGDEAGRRWRTKRQGRDEVAELEMRRGDTVKVETSPECRKGGVKQKRQDGGGLNNCWATKG